MMPLPEIPDTLIVLKEAMVAQASIQGLGVAGKIYEWLPSAPVWPVWRITEVDSIEDRPEMNAVRVQIDILGDDGSAAAMRVVRQHAKVLQSVVRDLDGNWTSGKLRNVRFDRRLPSPTESGRARVIVDLTMEVYGAGS